uniref:Uncharacterized protein n=1 Tax=Rhizophagus irregularis (strain DAOM 181602 / DAOM 197198 / MUCL 43194) TaxID=747089 RepID=U9UQM5_RHIID
MLVTALPRRGKLLLQMKDESIYIRVIFDKKRFIWIQLRAAGLAETEPLSSMTIKWFLVYKVYRPHIPPRLSHIQEYDNLQLLMSKLGHFLVFNAG